MVERLARSPYRMKSDTKRVSVMSDYLSMNMEGYEQHKQLECCLAKLADC